MSTVVVIICIITIGTLHHLFRLFAPVQRAIILVSRSDLVFINLPWHYSIRADAAFKVRPQPPLFRQCFNIPIQDIGEGEDGTILADQVKV